VEELFQKYNIESLSTTPKKRVIKLVSKVFQRLTAKRNALLETIKKFTRLALRSTDVSRF
jgi:hypothetical protein